MSYGFLAELGLEGDQSGVYAAGWRAPSGEWIESTSPHSGEVIGRVMDLRPKGIRTHLGLDKPIYARTSAYGHFGREPEADGGFSWERVDLVEAIKSALS